MSRFGMWPTLVVLLVLISWPSATQADPITFTSRANVFVSMVTFPGGNPPPVQLSDSADDEIPGADDLGPATASVTGTGVFAGYTGSATA